MHATKGKILFALLITSMIAVGFSIHPSYAAPTIYLDPSSIVDQTKTPGTFFNVTVWVNEGTDVASHQINLFYDAGVLNITRAWIPNWDNLYIFKGKFVFTPPPAFRTGEVQLGDLIVSGTTATFTTPKKLALIEFKVMGIGRTTLFINNAGTYIQNSALDEIPVIKVDGYFDNRPPMPTATVYLDPLKKTDPTLTPSSTFTWDARIINASNLVSFQFKLSYDQNILNVNSAALTGFFLGTPTVSIDNVLGQLTFSTSSPPSPVSGNGILATVTFHVVGLGRSTLNLTDVLLTDQFGSPQNYYPIPQPSGTFNNVLMASLFVDPPEIIDPTLRPGSLVNINVTIDDVEGMYGYAFKLGYDPNVLTAIGFRVHRVQNEGNFTIQMFIDDITGVIGVNVTYRPPATPITTFTPAALVTITFQIDGFGTSVLHLYDTHIVDQFGSPIPHETTDGFIQTVTRDVAIISVVPSTNWAYPGWPVNITVVAKNKGMLPETFNVKAFYESNLIGIKPVPSLAPGAEISLVFTWDTTGVPANNYTIRAEATTVPYETNTADNVLIDGSVEIRSIYRDVAVTNVTSSRTWVYSGWKFNITITVKNLGNVSETFGVHAYYNSTLIGTQNVVNLPTGNETSLIFTWDTTGVAPGNYTLKGQADLIPFEFNAANNVYVDGEIQVRLLGDINGDGTVDIKDLSIAGKAFGSYRGHPRYNPDADVNQDGTVDIRDLALIAKNFGKRV